LDSAPIALGEMQAKLTAAHAAALRRSDAHDPYPLVFT
jgi:hypothetical protein